MLVLTVVSHHSATLGSQATIQFDLSGGTIGRAQSNDWVLPDPEKFMSGTHARLLSQGGGWYVVDLSTNGVFLNSPDQRLGNGNQAQINQGDILYIGEYKISVAIEESLESAPDPFFGQDLSGPASGRQDFGLAPELPGAELPGEGVIDPLEALDSGRGNDPIWPSEATGPSAGDDFGPASSLNDSFSPPDISNSTTDSGGLIGDDWDVTDYSGASTAKTYDIPEQTANTSSTENTFPTENTSSEPEQPIPGDFRMTPEPPPAAPIPPVPQAPPAAPVPPAAQIPPAGQIPPTTVPPVSPAMPAGAQGAGGSGDVLQPILSQLGLTVEQLTLEQKQALMENVSTMLTLVAKGMREVLAARASLKSEFRIAVTTIKHTENNPLKFSVSDEEALRRLLLPSEPGYMATQNAVSEAFDDLRAHQVGMLAGMRASFDMMAQEFTPANLEKDCDAKSKGGLALGSKKMKYWDHFVSYYDQHLGGSDDSFLQYFGEAFVEAYDRQIEVMRGK